MKLSQSNVIFFCLFAAFVVFITLRGELPKYLAVLFTTQASASSGSGASGGSGGGGGIGDALGALGGIDQFTSGLGAFSGIGSAVTTIQNKAKSLLSGFGAAGGIFQ